MSMLPSSLCAWLPVNINGRPHLSGYPLDFKVDGNLEQHHSPALQYSDIVICAFHVNYQLCIHVHVIITMVTCILH